MPTELCNDESLLPILSAVKKMMLLIQIIVPIILIIWGTISFIRLIQNPEEKNGIKKIFNKFLAAAIIFFIPIIVNAVMGILGDNTNFSSCWKVSSDYKSNSSSYKDPYQNDPNKNSRKKISGSSGEYE